MQFQSMTIFTILAAAFAAEPHFTREEALDACESAVFDQAQSRYSTSALELLDAGFDDRSGHPERITGALLPHRDAIADAPVGFACILNRETGEIRSAGLDPIFEERRHPEIDEAAIANCRRNVAARVQSAGYRKLKFRQIYADNRPGRTGAVAGDLWLAGHVGARLARFSCTADPATGKIRSLDLILPR